MPNLTRPRQVAVAGVKGTDALVAYRVVKQRFPFTVKVLVAMAIFLLVATGDSLAQTPLGSPTGRVDIKNEGQVLSKVTDIITPGAAYFIKSKGSQKVLDVTGGSKQPGAVVRQLTLNGNFGQKFIFTDAGGGFFFIRSTSGLFVTLRSDPVVSQPGKPPVLNQFLTQERLAKNTPISNGLNAQQWKVVESGEPTTFFILNKTNVNRALQPTSDGAGIATAPRDGNNLQKWILKLTTTEDNPDSVTAETGLVQDCTALLPGFELLTLRFGDVGTNVSPIFPEWRSVGENTVVDGISRPPDRSYKILEGVVNKNSPQVAFEDLPSSHFTHDFTFHVKPDAPFRYLLGKTANVVQPDMEVEWESGLAQADDRDVNPASAASIRGDSFGFYTKGHQRRDLIWNWPTANDWVHVEGIWIFDRGHPPARTEIHPAHFIAVKRDLPEKFAPTPGQPGQFFFATRADIFASGDGSVVWNNKGLHPFAQPVKMSERVYTVSFKHDLPRPTPNAKLKFGFQQQKGDSYPGQPIIQVFENGTPDDPTPHVVMSLAWAGNHAPDTAVFARTLFIYWDDTPTHGIPFDFPMKRVQVILQKVVIQDKEEGRDLDPGEYRLFADIGGRWLFLNEFTGASDIMKEGLGRVWDETFSQKHPLATGPFPKPPGAEFNFNFNQPFDLFLPPGKELRLSVGGWEGDYIEDHFGNFANPYLSCPEAIRFAKKEFSGNEFLAHGGLDDSVGAATFFISFDSAKSLGRLSFPSEGEIAEEPHNSDNDPNNDFRVTVSVTVSPATP